MIKYTKEEIYIEYLHARTSLIFHRMLSLKYLNELTRLMFMNSVVISDKFSGVVC